MTYPSQGTSPEAAVNGHPVEPSSRRDRRLSPAGVLGLVVLGGVLAVAVAMQLFVAQQIPELTESALDAAEKLWSQAGPDSYDMDLEIRGAQPGVVHVEVRDGQVAALQRDGRTPSQRRTWDYWSVPGRFDELERELEMAADPEHEMQATAGTRISARCEFDSQYGFPRRFHRITYGGGTEVYWSVTNFVPQK